MALSPVLLDLRFLVLVQFPMEFLHEFVEMNAALPSVHLAIREKQVHQIAFSRPHIPMEINSTGNSRDLALLAASVRQGERFLRLRKALEGNVIVDGQLVVRS